MKLTDRVALVTGGAHRLGRAIALALAERGALIALHYDTSRVAARQTAGEIAAHGFDVEIFQADLSEPSQIAKLISRVGKRFGRLDILVNSAASFERRDFDEITAGDWDAVMALNVRAAFLTSQHAVPLMRASTYQPTLIVNIADLSGLYPWLGYAHHSVSKAALIHLTKSLARELAPDIRANAIIPGAILPPPDIDAASPEWQGAGKRNLLKRVGDPADIGRAVVFLAESDFITGAIIPVDGGESLLGPVGH